MARYKLTHTDTVLRPPHVSFPPIGHEHEKYVEWLADGNTPDPADGTGLPIPPVLPPIVSKPTPADNSIPAVRDKLSEVIQVLQDAGLMRES